MVDLLIINDFILYMIQQYKLKGQKYIPQTS